MRAWKPGMKHFHPLSLYEVIYWYFFFKSVFCLSVTPFYPVLISREGTTAEKRQDTTVARVRNDACLSQNGRMGGGGRRWTVLIKYLALRQSSFPTFFQKLNKYCCFQISANLLALETWCTEALHLFYHWK